jgi:hypothetical protein
VFDDMHQKRMFVLHLENVSKNPLNHVVPTDDKRSLRMSTISTSPQQIVRRGSKTLCATLPPNLLAYRRPPSQLSWTTTIQIGIHSIPSQLYGPSTHSILVATY